jgi:hypothetical protein
LNRREVLSWLAAAAAGTAIPQAWGAGAEPAQRSRRRRKKPAPPPRSKDFDTVKLTKADEDLLDDLQRRASLFFVEQADGRTGQVLDRARNQGADGTLDPRHMSSTAATGFGLSALCIAAERRYMPRAKVRDQVLRTLRFHSEQMPNEHGFFFHFNDALTGQPHRGVEVSSIDTALLLCGVLTARAYFTGDAEIHRYATAIYERVDFPWMLNGGTQFSMGWHPPGLISSGGFLKARWNHYCELMMLPLLAMGSPTHPVDPVVWSSFTRPVMQYDGFEYISSDDPLFVHQYSHAWFDFRGKRDAYANYFENSVTATKAHEAFCLSLGSPYSEDYWGISASDSRHGYRAWGGPPKHGGIDGSVVPCATGGSLAFDPEPCLRVQRALKQNYGDRALGRYGLCDAFHPDGNWYDTDVLGIDLGITVLMAENLRSGFVWRTFARNPEVAVAMGKAGFHPDNGNLKA